MNRSERVVQILRSVAGPTDDVAEPPFEQRPYVAALMRTCEFCGASFLANPHLVHRRCPQRYCSARCRIKRYRSSAKHRATNAAYMRRRRAGSES